MNLTLEMLLSIVTALPDPLFILTENGQYAGVFGGGDRNYYHDGSGLVGSSLYDVLPRDKADWFLEQISQSLREQRMCTVEYGLAGSDVEGLDTEKGPSGEIWFEGRIQPLPFRIEGERAVVWTARNITRRHQLEAQLLRLSEIDELTGAYTRRRLMKELDLKFREFRRYAEPTALMMVDIDHFKQVNDEFGHVAGDQILQSTVHTCMQQLREVDLFSRFGGEEFVVLCPHTGEQEAREMAERLRQTVMQNAISLSGRKIHVTISIGVSLIREADQSFESVIKRIDDALYAAKDKGRNCVVVAGLP